MTDEMPGIVGITKSCDEWRWICDEPLTGMRRLAWVRKCLRRYPDVIGNAFRCLQVYGCLVGEWEVGDGRRLAWIAKVQDSRGSR
jgi:hypothetical protein